MKTHTYNLHYEFDSKLNEIIKFPEIDEVYNVKILKCNSFTNSYINVLEIDGIIN